MHGPGKELCPIPGQANIQEFYVNRLLDKLFAWFEGFLEQMLLKNYRTRKADACLGMPGRSL